MNYIVLIKQVPDIKNIPNEAWDWEKGTLKRALLDNTCNELDKQALAFALNMRKQCPGKVVSLSMGPPMAEEVLRYSLALGVDEAVLLTDRKFAGADTAATSYSLAQTIRKVERDIFGGDRNYVVVCGMQSIDGDTAQCPPQVAEELGMVHIAYASSFSFDGGKLKVKRITRRGGETVTPDSYPCLVTVTEHTEAPNASFAGTRWANSQEIYQWSADDVGAAPDLIGLKGSRTNVVKMFSPKDFSKKNCVFEKNLENLVRMVDEAYHHKPVVTAGQEKENYQFPEGKKGDYSGEIWIYAEQEGGEINPSSFELLGKATELAGELGEEVGAVLVGKDVRHLSPDLIAYGADKVYLLEHELLEQFRPLPYCKAIIQAIDKYNPQMMLFSATPLGRELAPRVAYQAKSGLTADCTELRIVDFKRGKQEHVGVLRQTRPALGGNVMASIVSTNSRVQMSTVRPGVMGALEYDDHREGEVISCPVDLDASDLGVTIVSSEISERTFDLSSAEVIVSGGKGLRTKANFDKYLSALAKSLGRLLEKDVVICGSRVAVESGFTDRSHQVGQTGQTVKPDLYVAVGISGAVQHVTGCQNSRLLLAINSDSNAPIFKVADFGVVGNAEEIIPQLVSILDRQGGQVSNVS